jgi:deoxyadenosine/deoxycytidine kinase
MKFRSIAVEGPIGVGKTSFVELLARKFDAHKVLEEIDNPFLSSFYEDKQGAAFQAQLFFLLSRFRQLQDLTQRDLFQQITICDYIFPKDKIFAYLNLDDSELLIYDKLYAMLDNYLFVHDTQTPLLVIDTTDIDFVHHEEHLDELVDQIRKMDRGVQYYRPLGSSV